MQEVRALHIAATGRGTLCRAISRRPYMLSTITRSVCAVTLLALTAAPAAAQTTLDKRILFTFSAPVTMPGVTLPAGTYMFHVGNPTGDRSVVHVRSKDGSQVYATFLTI